MSKKVLDQFGVYNMIGYEIGNHKDLGLDVDRVYRVKKGSEYIKSLAIQLGANDFTVYEGGVHNSEPIGFVTEHTYNDGILLADISVNSDLELVALYSANGVNDSGNYMGVDYDLELVNPILHSVHLVGMRRLRIEFPQQ